MTLVKDLIGIKDGIITLILEFDTGLVEHYIWKDDNWQLQR